MKCLTEKRTSPSSIQQFSCKYPLVNYLDPIEAFCHLPSGKTSLGETENITIALCNTKFCFEHYVIHQTPIGQIQSLKDGSISCSQEIVYSCKTAPWKVHTDFKQAKLYKQSF